MNSKISHHIFPRPNDLSYAIEILHTVSDSYCLYFKMFEGSLGETSETKSLELIFFSS